MKEGDGELGVDEGGGGGIVVGGDERGELHVVEQLQLAPVAVGLGHPLLLALCQPLHRPVRPLDPLGVPVSPNLAAETEDAREPAMGTLVQI